MTASPTGLLPSTRAPGKAPGLFGGTAWCARRQIWSSRISVNNKRLWLGDFKTREEAAAAYAQAEANLRSVRVRKPKRRSSPDSRFFAKTTVDQATGCLIWCGARDKDGYGKFSVYVDGDRVHVRAHRYAYFLRHGAWPTELALHSCDTPACVEADHLEDGDHAKNLSDSISRGRRSYARDERGRFRAT